MSLKTWIIKKLGTGSVGTAIEGFLFSESDKALAVLKASDVGSVVAAEVADLKDQKLTGAQKALAAVLIAQPLVLKYANAAGPTLLLADVLGITQALVQSIYNDTVSTTAGKVSASILASANIKIPTTIKI